MYPRRLLIVIGVLAFLASLLVLMPVRVAVAMLPGALPVQAPAGSLLDGQVTVVGAGETLRIAWRLQPAWLLTLGVGGQWSVTAADGLAADGSLVRRPWGTTVAVVQARLPAGFLNRHLRGAGVTIDQPLMVRDLRVAGRPGAAVRAASGRLAWGPGTLRWREQQPDAVSLPALRGVLSADDGSLQLLVDGEKAPGETLLSARLDPVGGEYHVVVTRQAAPLLGRPLQPGASSGSPLFEVRQRLR